MEQGTCGEYCVRGTLWSRVHVGSSVLGGYPIEQGTCGE